VNKQIYHEGIEILYSKNMFKFQYPRQLFAFEQPIGLENCKRMRNICIWIRFPEYQEVVRDPRNLLPSEYDSVPTHWIATLKACGLKNITHLTIEAETITGDVLFLLPMPKDLQESIEQFLERGPNDTVPRLSLTGFQEDEKDKFPKRWEIVKDQWKCYKERMAGIQRELEEYEAYCKTERAFDLQNSDDDEESDDEEFDDEDSDDEQEFYSPLSV
jgi:hypothetical protein